MIELYSSLQALFLLYFTSDVSQRDNEEFVRGVRDQKLGSIVLFEFILTKDFRAKSVFFFYRVAMSSDMVGLMQNLNLV